jgi:hypothetical protein
MAEGAIGSQRAQSESRIRGAPLKKYDYGKPSPRVATEDGGPSQPLGWYDAIPFGIEEPEMIHLSEWRRDSGNQFAHLAQSVILKRLLDLSTAIHHERTLADFLTFEPVFCVFANCFVRAFLAEQFQSFRLQTGLSEEKFVHILIALVYTSADGFRILRRLGIKGNQFLGQIMLFRRLDANIL